LEQGAEGESSSPDKGGNTEIQALEDKPRLDGFVDFRDLFDETDIEFLECTLRYQVSNYRRLRTEERSEIMKLAPWAMRAGIHVHVPSTRNQQDHQSGAPSWETQLWDMIAARPSPWPNLKLRLSIMRSNLNTFRSEKLHPRRLKLEDYTGRYVKLLVKDGLLREKDLERTVDILLLRALGAKEKYERGGWEEYVRKLRRGEGLAFNGRKVYSKGVAVRENLKELSTSVTGEKRKRQREPSSDVMDENRKRQRV